MGTGRLESFSDGVIAVAITLLVLSIAVPAPPDAHVLHAPGLAHQLGRQWPRYAAYATSFLTIGIIWINHHAMISRLRQADHSILILNLLLLMSIGILPFATDLMATYLNEPRGQKLAAAVYGGAFLLMGIMFAAVNCQIMLRRPHLLHHRPAPEQRRRILARSLAGVPPYVVATVLAVVSPYITLAICAAIGVYYALPIAAGINREPGRETA